MTKTVTVHYSPCKDDETPFSYEEDSFVGWVYEVFLEGYKTDGDGKPLTPIPSFEEATDIIAGAGYLFYVEDGTTLEQAKVYLDGMLRCELADHAFGDKEISWHEPDPDDANKLGKYVADGYNSSRTTYVVIKGKASFNDDDARSLLTCGKLAHYDRNDAGD